MVSICHHVISSLYNCHLFHTEWCMKSCTEVKCYLLGIERVIGESNLQLNVCQEVYHQEGILWTNKFKINKCPSTYTIHIFYFYYNLNYSTYHITCYRASLPTVTGLCILSSLKTRALLCKGWITLSNR